MGSGNIGLCMGLGEPSSSMLGCPWSPPQRGHQQAKGRAGALVLLDHSGISMERELGLLQARLGFTL